MNHITKSIPNALTCANLICGCIAIYYAVLGNFEISFWLVIASAIFDFFDGFAARLLKAYSPIGADLDSLADVVSFGVAPSMVAFIYLQSVGTTGLESILAFGAFFLAVFGALRLAMFNNDPSQSEEFHGLPIPGMAMFIVSFVAFCIPYLINQGISTTLCFYSTMGIVALFCWLMVSKITMFSFKFKSFGFRRNALKYFFAIFAVLSVIIFKYASPAIIVAAYVIVSIITGRRRSVNN